MFKDSHSCPQIDIQWHRLNLKCFWYKLWWSNWWERILCGHWKSCLNVWRLVWGSGFRRLKSSLRNIWRYCSLFTNKRKSCKEGIGKFIKPYYLIVRWKINSVRLQLKTKYVRIISKETIRRNGVWQCR